MRERMERLVVLPFSIGCVSQSSVAVGGNNPKKTKPDANPPSTRGDFLSGGKTKNSYGLPMKSNFTAGFHRLKKSFKSFSQIFVYKEEEMEEMEMEMEIGLPTDVKHVTHIGWDGSTTTMKSWDDFKAPDFLTLPSISLRHFELAMAAQVDEPNDNGSSLRFT